MSGALLVAVWDVESKQLLNCGFQSAEFRISVKGLRSLVCNLDFDLTLQPRRFWVRVEYLGFGFGAGEFM